MGITLTPGVIQATVQVKDTRDQVLYEANFASKTEAKEFIAKYQESREGYGLLHSIVFPLRTGNLKDFAEDLFLPTWVHFASKIENIALRFFASIPAIALDFLTFPVRLLTVPFQIYSNDKNPEGKHPILGLIENHPLAQKAIEDGMVNLCYEIDDVQISDPIHATRSSVKGTIEVALKRLPGGTKKHSLEENKQTDYHGVDGKWHVIGGGRGSSSHSVLAF